MRERRTAPNASLIGGGDDLGLFLDDNPAFIRHRDSVRKYRGEAMNFSPATKSSSGLCDVREDRWTSMTEEEMRREMGEEGIEMGYQVSHRSRGDVTGGLRRRGINSDSERNRDALDEGKKGIVKQKAPLPELQSFWSRRSVRIVLMVALLLLLNVGRLWKLIVH